MNLWMVYTSNMKRSGIYKRCEKGGCTLHLWPNHERSAVVLDHLEILKAFSW